MMRSPHMNSSKVFRLLLVEDNPADVYLLRQALKMAGLNFELKVIDHGGDALHFVHNCAKVTETDKFDLAILDLNLPGYGGLEVLTAIRQSEALADLRVVVLTSSAAPSERNQVEKLQISRFITKPPELADFLQIGNLLKEVLIDRDHDGVHV